MGDAASLAKAFQDYGIYFVCVILAGAVVKLWMQLSAERAARLADKDKAHDAIMAFAAKSIEADKDATHALAALTEAIKSRPHV